MYPYKNPPQDVKGQSAVSVRLRDYSESDYGLLASWDAAYYSEIDTTEPFDERQLRSDIDLAKSDPKHKIIIAQAGDDVAGFILAEEMMEDGAPLGYITNIHVDKRFRNMGLAKRLLIMVEEHFRRRQIKRLQLEVFETNSAAKNLYLKNGYSQVGDYLEKTLT